MNMTLHHVPQPDGFRIERGNEIDNLISGMLKKEIYVAFGGVGTHALIEPYFDSTNTCYMMSARWYIPFSVKYPM
jgi:hypothetical protein